MPTSTSGLCGAAPVLLPVGEPSDAYKPPREDGLHTDQNQQAHNTPSHTLGALQPTPLLPRHSVKRRIEAVVALQRIEHLEVSASQLVGGRTVYCVGIYYHTTHSNIPVHGPYARQKTPAPVVEPNVTLEISYEDFLRLSHRAYELTRLSHTTASCAFCRPVIFYNTNSVLKPRWNAHWFKRDRQVCEMLTAYLEKMLTLVVAVPTSAIDLCRGQERVARVLQDFLKSPGENERVSS